MVRLGMASKCQDFSSQDTYKQPGHASPPLTVPGPHQSQHQSISLVTMALPASLAIDDTRKKPVMLGQWLR